MNKWARLRAVWVVVVVVVAAVGLAGVPVAPPAAAATGSNPVGSFDSFAQHAGTTLVKPDYNPGPSTWTVYGWAADADAPGQPIPIHVYVNGVGAAINTTGSPRPDVAAAVGFAGPDAGFQVQVPTMDADTTVCVFAINVGRGTGNTLLGCRPVDGRDHADPVGSWDVTTAQPGAVRLAGWTADPDRAYDPDAAIGDVRVYMDGIDWGELHTGAPRPDVATAVPWAGPNAGFDQTIVALPGTHQLCLFSLNLGIRGTQNLTLGCRTVLVDGVTPAVTGEPRGSIDGSHLQGSDVRFWTAIVTGWAFDPLASGPGQVTLRWSALPFDRTIPELDLTLTKGPVLLVDGAVATTIPRPDVQAAFPAAPLNTGWAMDIGPVDLRAVCAYAISAGPGHEERLVGCLR
jgi:hypothetical protein